MEKIRVHRDGQRDLVFQGAKIAGTSNMHRDDTRWTELVMWKTAGGKYVIQRQYITRWQGERDTVEAHVFDSVDAIREHYGDELPNLDYALISEAVETCPELDELLVDEIE